MLSSSDIGLLSRVAELARRFGLRPSEAEAELNWIQDGSFEDFGHYRLNFASVPTDPGKAEKLRKMQAALGCEGASLTKDGMDEIEDAVERAISLAPRARSL